MRAGTNSNPRITFADIEAARARLEAAAGIPVSIEPGGGHGAFSWSVSPAFGLSFGHLGKTKRDTVNTLDRLTAAQLKMREDERRAAKKTPAVITNRSGQIVPDNDRRVLTVPSAGIRIAVETPREIYEILTDLLTDYTFDQIVWEA